VAKYLLIESRDPFENAVVPAVRPREESREGRQRGHVVPCRTASFRRARRKFAATAAAKGGVEIRGRIPLRERGIAGKLAEGVRSSPLDTVVDRLLAGCKALWH
jgi:hypothetical protein